MRVAVTGASGFLGKYICRALVGAGQEVFPYHFSNPLQVYDISLSSKPLDIAKPPADLFDYLGAPDALVHLSWAGLPNYRNQDHLSVELLNQIAFLEKSIECGVGSLCVTGTCFEYGMQSGMLSENSPLQPDNPYGQAKVSLLQTLQELQAGKEFNLTWARLFYMFGEGQSANSLWPQFQAAVSNGDEVFNMSGGQQVRDFLPVEEIARLITVLATNERNNGVVNVCSGQPTTVETLVRKWAEEANWTGELNLGHYPYPDYEPMSFWGERTKLDRILAV